MFTFLEYFFHLKRIFQIFTTVVIFGLFHGLVFLPVILSLIGPEPYDTKFLSPIEDQPEVKYAEIAANQEYNVNQNLPPEEHIRLSEIQSSVGNGNLKHSDWSDFPLTNGDLCNSLHNIPETEASMGNVENNPRVSVV